MCRDIKEFEFLTWFSVGRPSFVNSPIGFVFIFITSFVLLSETYKLIKYFLEDKK